MREEPRVGDIHERSVRRLANDHGFSQFLLADIREVLQVVFLLQGLGNSFDLGLGQHVDGATAPSGTGQSATQGSSPTSDVADLIHLRCTAIVLGAARSLGLVQELTQVLDASFIEGARLREACLEVQDSAGLGEAVQGALTKEETLCLNGERRKVLGFEFGDSDAEKLGDLLASVSFLLRQKLQSALDDGVNLVLQGVAETALFAHQLVVEVTETEAERAVVLGEGQAVPGSQNHGGERALSDTEVVVTGSGLGLVGGDEALGHKESDFLIGLGNGNVLNGEVREELGVQEVSSAREDGGGLVHAGKQ